MEGAARSTINRDAEAGPPGRIAGWLRARTPALPWWTRAGYALLPPRCTLCGGEGDLGAVDLCACCLGTLPFADRAAGPPDRPGAATLAPFMYRDPVGSGLRALKFHGDLRPARVFGALLAAAVATTAADDVAGPAAPAAAPVVALVPVPLHRTRHAERGFNQAEAIARHAGRWLDVPVRPQWLSRLRATRPQTALRGAERRRNLAAAFAATPALHAALAAVHGAVHGAGRPWHAVALVDDVLTTGATVAAARSALLEAGVPAVQVWTVARAGSQDARSA